MTTNQILIKEAGTSAVAQVSFATHASYAPAAANVIEIGSPTTTLVEVEMSLLDLADTAARASAKADLGTVRAARYGVTACIEYQVTAPTTGTLIEFYWAGSHQSGATVGNPGYVSGSDAAYTGTPATLAEGVAQLTFLGVMVVSADIEFQIADIGVFSPEHRYGCLVVKNETGQPLCDTDIIDTAVVFTPIVDDVAAAS